MISSALAILLLALPLSAARADCPSNSASQGNVRVQAFDLGDDCGLVVSPANSISLVFRDYIFGSSGLFMIFDSIDGPEATSTGARGYFFFPRKQEPSYQFLGNGDLQVTSASGQTFVFSGATERLESVPGVSYSEDQAVSMNNAGGVEITRAGGVWLDGGWRVGGAAYANPNRTSTFQDARGNSCRVSNSEIFTLDANDNPVFNFQTDPDLAAFLNHRCPLLDAAPLESSAAAVSAESAALQDQASAAYQKALELRDR